MTSTFIISLSWYLLNGSWHFSYLYVTQFITLGWLTVLANKRPKSTLNHNQQCWYIIKFPFTALSREALQKSIILTSLLKDIKGKPIMIWGMQDRSLQWAVAGKVICQVISQCLKQWPTCNIYPWLIYIGWADYLEAIVVMIARTQAVVAFIGDILSSIHWI